MQKIPRQIYISPQAEKLDLLMPLTLLSSLSLYTEDSEDIILDPLQDQGEL